MHARQRRIEAVRDLEVVLPYDVSMPYLIGLARRQINNRRSKAPAACHPESLASQITELLSYDPETAGV